MFVQLFLFSHIVLEKLFLQETHFNFQLLLQVIFSHVQKILVLFFSLSISFFTDVFLFCFQLLNFQMDETYLVSKLTVSSHAKSFTAWDVRYSTGREVQGNIRFKLSLRFILLKCSILKKILHQKSIT